MTFGLGGLMRFTVDWTYRFTGYTGFTGFARFTGLKVSGCTGCRDV